jgi:hypothetical protein
MVVSKKVKLEIEVEIDMPIDIIDDKHRLKAIEEGLVKSVSKGLYEQGVSFKMNKVKLKT